MKSSQPLSKNSSKTCSPKAAKCELILGSGSPRRKKILEFFSIPFTQIESFYDEEIEPFQGNPEPYVSTLAEGKASALKDKFPESLILTADTIVFREGKIYGKAKSEEEAYHALLALTGKWHSVYTAVTVRYKDKVLSKVEETKVLMNPLTQEEIRRYLAHTHWQDKAGSYAIQDKGGIIVSKIDGCYYNVMGLPINTVVQLLKHFDLALWDYL